MTTEEEAAELDAVLTELFHLREWRGRLREREEFLKAERVDLDRDTPQCEQQIEAAWERTRELLTKQGGERS